MWATLSQPASMVRAYWQGAVTTSTLPAICLAIVLATNLRRMSPTTIPRMPPFEFFKAVILPILTPSTATKGACPRARTVANRNRSDVSLAVSRTCCRWSAVIPEGPVAAPLLDDRKLWTNGPSSNENASGLRVENDLRQKRPWALRVSFSHL